VELHLKEPIDGDSLMFCGIEFQTVGAANRIKLNMEKVCYKISLCEIFEQKSCNAFICLFNGVA